MALKIVRETQAAEMLRSSAFRAQWLSLYERCPWATAGQHPAFVASWYESYKASWKPLLVCEFSAPGELTGLLPLAIDQSKTVVAGGRQAEYKTWLALPANGARFLNDSLTLLSRGAGVRALTFRYLPPGAPTEDLRLADSLWVCEVETHKRPIVRLDNGPELAEYLQQKTNKTLRNSWNRLRRIGIVQLKHVRECHELIPVFDQLIDWYEVRQEKAHGKRPFKDDPHKKAWHLRLLKEGLLHVTLLKAGEEIVSALFGLSDGKTYSVMMPMFSEEYAAYSPIAIHHLMLVEQLQADGFLTLDLTPGPDPFKNRFAGNHEDVKALSIYFKQREWIKAKVRQRTQAFTKSMLFTFGFAPSTIGRALPRFRAVRGAFRNLISRTFPRWKRDRAKLSYD